MSTPEPSTPTHPGNRIEHLEIPRGTFSAEDFLSSTDQLDKITKAMGMLGDLILIGMLATYILVGLRRHLVVFPALGVCLNMSWESFYAVQADVSTIKKLIFVFWLLLDMAIFWMLFKFGRLQVKWTPKAHHRFSSIIWFFFLIALSGQIAFYHSFEKDALGVSAYMTNFIVSASFVFYYFNWHEAKCHSILGAWLKFLGTGIITAANLMLIFSAGAPSGIYVFLVYLMIGTSVLDILYLVLLYRLKGLETVAAHT